MDPDEDIPAGPEPGKYNVYLSSDIKNKGVANSMRRAEQVLKKGRSGVLYYHGYKVGGGFMLRHIEGKGQSGLTNLKTKGGTATCMEIRPAPVHPTPLHFIFITTQLDDCCS